MRHARRWRGRAAAPAQPPGRCVVTHEAVTVAITGTRGIPNNYGGFEQFAQHLSVELAARGFGVLVYNPHFHGYREPSYRGVAIVRKWCPEAWLGAGAHYVYDYLCLRDAVRRRVDLVLECGYTSFTPGLLLVRRGGTRIVLNTDGIEWKRAKWGRVSSRLIALAESGAVRRADALVADNEGIRTYLRERYALDSTTIAYGATLPPAADPGLLADYGLTPDAYFLALARIEPENNFEMILDGYLQSGSAKPFCIVGNPDTRYGAVLRARFHDARIRFLGANYDLAVVHALRHFASLYFHGHSVGGTNPSLLDAMASEALICANENVYNRSVLGESALYFSSSADVARLLAGEADYRPLRPHFAKDNLEKIRTRYSWPCIADGYERLLLSLVTPGRASAPTADGG